MTALQLGRRWLLGLNEAQQFDTRPVELGVNTLSFLARELCPDTADGETHVIGLEHVDARNGTIPNRRFVVGDAKLCPERLRQLEGACVVPPRSTHLSEVALVWPGPQPKIRLDLVTQSAQQRTAMVGGGERGSRARPRQLVRGQSPRAAKCQTLAPVSDHGASRNSRDPPERDRHKVHARQSGRRGYSSLRPILPLVRAAPVMEGVSEIGRAHV